MRNASPVASKSLLFSVLILAAATVLAVELSTTPLSRAAAIPQSMPRPSSPQRFQEAIADTDVGPGFVEAQPLSPGAPAK